MASTTLSSISDIQTDYHGRVLEILSGNLPETLLFNYFGDFNQVKVDYLLHIVETSIIEAGDKRQTMKRICSVLIELLQNISIHGAKLSNGRMYAYCIISHSEEYYKLYTGNLVLAVDASCLESRLKNLIGMDINEIRKTFIETLCNDDFDMKGGAGLGLLTIAKRAKEKIQYRLSSLDEHLSYYQLEVKIPKI